MFKYSALLIAFIAINIFPLALAGKGKVIITYHEGTCLKFPKEDCYYGGHHEIHFDTSKNQVEDGFTWYGPPYEPSNAADKKDTSKAAWEQKCTVTVTSNFNEDRTFDLTAGQERGTHRILNSDANIKCTKSSCHFEDKCVDEYVIPIVDTFFTESDL